MKLKLILLLCSFWIISSNKTFAQFTGVCDFERYSPPAQDPWWYAERWDVHTLINNTYEADIPSPYFETSNNCDATSNIFPLCNDTDKDFRYEKGWRFISKKIGEPGIPQPNPYFVFYNIYTAKIRLFILMTNIEANAPQDGQKNIYVRVKPRLSEIFNNNDKIRYAPSILTELGNPASTLSENGISREYEISQFWKNEPSKWFKVEFPIAYDPCTCTQTERNRNPILDFVVYEKKDEKIVICNFDNRVQENCEDFFNANIDPRNNPLPNNIVSSAGDAPRNAGKLTENMKDVLKETAKILPFVNGGTGNQTSDRIKRIKIAQQKNYLEQIGNNPQDAMILFEPGMEIVTPHIKNFTGSGKETSAISFQTHNSKGSVNSDILITQGEILVPGAYNENIPMEKRPEYNNTMGIMNIVKAPVLNVRYTKVDNTTQVYFEAPNRASELPQFVLNPALEIDEERSEVYISYEFEDDLKVKIAPNSNLKLASNLDYTSWKSQEGSPRQYPFYTSPSYTLSCLVGRYMGFIKEREFNNIVNIGSFEIPFKVQNVRMKVMARLRRINSNDPKDDIVYINRYPVTLDERGQISENKKQFLFSKMLSVEHRGMYVVYDGWYPSFPYFSDYTTNNYPVTANHTLTIIPHVPVSNNIGGAGFALVLPALVPPIPSNVTTFMAGKKIDVLPINSLGESSFVELLPGKSLSINDDVYPANTELCDNAPPRFFQDVESFCNSRTYTDNHNFVRPAQSSQVDKDSQASTSDLITELRVFPNPATGSSVEIAYSVSEQSEVRISVLGAKGEKIAELVQGRMDAGKYDLVWDINQVPNGLYFCTMEVNGKRIVKRLVIQK